MLGTMACWEQLEVGKDTPHLSSLHPTWLSCVGVEPGQDVAH